MTTDFWTILFQLSFRNFLKLSYNPQVLPPAAYWELQHSLSRSSAKSFLKLIQKFTTLYESSTHSLNVSPFLFVLFYLKCMFIYIHAQNLNIEKKSRNRTYCLPNNRTLWNSGKGNRGAFVLTVDIVLVITDKLDGAGPVDNRPSTDQLHHFVQFF